VKNRPVLDIKDCVTMSAAAQAEANAHGWNVSIAILDHGGHLLHFIRMDGAGPGTVTMSQRKAHTSAMTGRTSKSYEDRITAGRNSVLSVPYLTIQGGLPVIVDGVCVGAIGVSGLESHLDEQVAQAGINALGIRSQ
jgi:glc operon protein GlcG